jgi:hypothetical protein
VVVGEVPVVTTGIIEVVGEVSDVVVVVGVGREVTVTTGAVVSGTPLDPVQATPNTTEITPAVSRLTGSAESGEEVDDGHGMPSSFWTSHWQKVASPPRASHRSRQYDVSGTVPWGAAWTRLQNTYPGFESSAWLCRRWRSGSVMANLPGS